MKPTKKIYANKNDSCAVIVHKIISLEVDEFILYLPKNSIIAENPKNFKLLKREVTTVKKKVIIESVDNNILEMASASGLEIMDGLFGRSSSSRRALMDIVPTKSKLESTTENKKHFFKKNKISSFHKSINKIEEETEKLTSAISETEEIAEENPRRQFSFKKTGLILAFSAGLALAGYWAFFILPSVEILIERQKADWSFSGDVIASTQATAVSKEGSVIPAQIFTISKNSIGSFPASGTERVSQRARGTVTIWNAHSRSPQILARNTRFATLDGRIYRTISAVTVPGARISAGEIQPSSIDAEVIADIAGEAHNIGPVARLRIPGFQGTPRYTGFYGEFKTGASGGFIGEIKVPTESDISQAKEEVATKVRDAIRSSITMTIPPELKIIENAITYTITREGVTGDVNEQGEFTYGVIMEAKVPAFRENDIIALMAQKFHESNANSYDLISQNLSYTSAPTINLVAGHISIPLEFTGSWARSFDPGAFKTKILGMNSHYLREAVFSIPGVSNAQVNFSPFWVNSVPQDPARVRINLN